MQKAMSDIHNTGAVCGKAKAPAAEKSTKKESKPAKKGK